MGGVGECVVRGGVVLCGECVWRCWWCGEMTWGGGVGGACIEISVWFGGSV